MVPGVLNVSTAAMAKGDVKARTELATANSLERGVEKPEFFMGKVGGRVDTWISATTGKLIFDRRLLSQNRLKRQDLILEKPKYPLSKEGRTPIRPAHGIFFPGP
jgi:hypothetical protein